MRVPETKEMQDKRGRLSRMVKKSEVKLGAELPDAGISRRSDLPHVAIQVAIWVIELSMVEEVKEFSSKSQMQSIR